MNQKESDLELEKINKTLKIIYGDKGYIYRSLWHEKSYSLIIVDATHNYAYRGPTFPTIKETINDCQETVVKLLRKNAYVINDLVSEINELQSRIDELTKLLLLI